MYHGQHPTSLSLTVVYLHGRLVRAPELYPFVIYVASSFFPVASAPVSYPRVLTPSRAQNSSLSTLAFYDQGPSAQYGNMVPSRRFGDRTICFSLQSVTLAADCAARLPRWRLYLKRKI